MGAQRSVHCCRPMRLALRTHRTVGPTPCDAAGVPRGPNREGHRRPVPRPLYPSHCQLGDTCRVYFRGCRSGIRVFDRRAGPPRRVRDAGPVASVLGVCTLLFARLLRHFWLPSLPSGCGCNTRHSIGFRLRQRTAARHAPQAESIRGPPLTKPSTPVTSSRSTLSRTGAKRLDLRDYRLQEAALLGPYQDHREVRGRGARRQNR